MSDSASYKAAKTVQDNELKALKEIKRLSDQYDTDLVALLATLDYPSSFMSEARNILTNIRNAYGYQLSTLAGRITEIENTPLSTTGPVGA